jgi:very-long-chain (3R)-3-hydroxyacyl-CoA dehydratase
MLFAWGVTEVIRYSYYALSQMEIPLPKWFLWIRYSSFLPLYPIGVMGECSLLYANLGEFKRSGGEVVWMGVLAILGLIYPAGLFVLYSHMLSQRRKVLGGKSKGKGKAKAKSL